MDKTTLSCGISKTKAKAEFRASRRWRFVMDCMERGAQLDCAEFEEDLDQLRRVLNATITTLGIYGWLVERTAWPVTPILKGAMYITDGKTTKVISKGQPIPEGFRRGIE